MYEMSRTNPEAPAASTKTTSAHPASNPLALTHSADEIELNLSHLSTANSLPSSLGEVPFSSATEVPVEDVRAILQLAGKIDQGLPLTDDSLTSSIHLANLIRHAREI
jgi:hypothetical protein